MIKHLIINKENNQCYGYGDVESVGSIPYDFSTSNVSFDEFAINPMVYAYIDGQLIDKHTQEIERQNLEFRLNNIRLFRKNFLKAFDILEFKYINVINGLLPKEYYPEVASITESTWSDILRWKQQWLDITDNPDTPYPETPKEIEMFL